jgi:hypothetical protein
VRERHAAVDRHGALESEVERRAQLLRRELRGDREVHHAPVGHRAHVRGRLVVDLLDHLVERDVVGEEIRGGARRVDIHRVVALREVDDEAAAGLLLAEAEARLDAAGEPLHVHAQRERELLRRVDLLDLREDVRRGLAHHVLIEDLAHRVAERGQARLLERGRDLAGHHALERRGERERRAAEHLGREQPGVDRVGPDDRARVHAAGVRRERDDLVELLGLLEVLGRAHVVARLLLRAGLALDDVVGGRLRRAEHLDVVVDPVLRAGTAARRAVVVAVAVAVVPIASIAVAIVGTVGRCVVGSVLERCVVGLAHVAPAGAGQRRQHREKEGQLACERDRVCGHVQALPRRRVGSDPSM